MLLWSNLGLKPTWLLRGMGNSAPEADPRITLDQKKNALKVYFAIAPSSKKNMLKIQPNFGDYFDMI